MRICLLSYRGNMFCGGQGVYLYYLARSLVELGHDVHVMAGPPYPDHVPGAVMHRVPNHNFINKPREFLPRETPLSILAPLNLFEFFLSRVGPNPEMLAFSMRCYQKIKEFHQRERFDVVHDNQGLGYGLLLIRGLGVPVVSTIHHPLAVDRIEDIKQIQGLARKMKRSLYYPLFMQGFVARRLDAVVTVSEISRHMVARAYGLDKKRIHTIFNGVDLELFRPLPEIQKVPGRIIFVGSTEDRKKGIIYLLRAMKMLDDPQISLTIVDGRLSPERVYAKNLIQEMGLEQRVRLLEKIDNDALIREYNEAELAVVPSLFEGFGLPAAEAMACGLPVLAARAGALPQVVGEDGGAAVLVEPADAASLAREIKNLISDPQRKDQISKAARKRAETLFSWADAAEKVARVYNEVMRRSSN